jgi:hypothetical protein
LVVTGATWNALRPSWVVTSLENAITRAGDRDEEIAILVIIASKDGVMTENLAFGG